MSVPVQNKGWASSKMLLPEFPDSSEYASRISIPPLAFNALPFHFALVPELPFYTPRFGRPRRVIGPRGRARCLSCNNRG